jgi:hypothetical protein
MSLFGRVSDQKEIKHLVNIQKEQIDRVLRLRIKQADFSKKKRAQAKWERLHPLYLALDYLEPKDLVKILILNKHYRTKFKKRVYRTVFMNYGNKITMDQRHHCWFNILDVVNYLI